MAQDESKKKTNNRVNNISIALIVIFSIATISILAGVWATGLVQQYDSNIKLRAMLKGSIYGTGEVMTVFGACLDEYDRGIVNSTALISAWYPNGVRYLTNVSMTNLSLSDPTAGNGYFYWTGSMTSTGGTYLTQIICQAGGQTATAYGEWQNPVWVANIASGLEIANRTEYLIRDINGTVIGINMTVADINGTVYRIEELVKALTVTGLKRFYFYNESDPIIAGFTIMNLTVPAFNSSGMTTFTALANGEHELARRIFTASNLTVIPANVYKQHTTINRTAGTTRTVRLHSNIYIRSVGGSLRMIGDSIGSDATSAGYQDVDWTGTIPNDQLLAPGEYLVMILNATVSGGGAAPTFTLLVEGITGASLEIGVEGDFATNQALYNISINFPLSVNEVVQLSKTDLYNAIKSMDIVTWTIDTTSPFYNGGIGFGKFLDIDMSSPSKVFITSEYSVYTNVPYGWSIIHTSTERINDIDAEYGGDFKPYMIGTENGYGINGGSLLNIPGASSQNIMAVKLFEQPINTGLYAMNNLGAIYYSSNMGLSWANVANMAGTCSRDEAEISDVFWNDIAQNTYSILFTGCGSSMIYFNGSSYNTISNSINLTDGYLIKKDLGYVLGHDTQYDYVYKFNGTGLEQMFKSDLGVRFVDISPVDGDDIWLFTSNPALFYHYNGVNWEFARLAYGNYDGYIYVEFNDTETLPNFPLIEGSVYDMKHGYAIGEDGNIFKLYSESGARFDNIDTTMNAIYANVNGTIALLNSMYLKINDTYYMLNNTYTLLQDTYQLVNTSFNYTNTQLNLLNQSMQANFNYTNSLIVQAANIANASVDRNDSLLAQLLYALIGSSSPGYINSTLNVTVFQEDQGRYWRDWTVKCRVYDFLGRQQQSPDVYCILNTTIAGEQYMEAEGEHFSGTVFINQLGDFDYDIRCFFT